MHEPQCRGVDSAGSPDSDYELWTPHDGRFGDNRCFLGMHKTFVRRKQDALCFNGEEHETITHIEPCTCSDYDFECDLGYVRSEEMGGQCVEMESDLTEEEKRVNELQRQNQQCQEYGFYEITRGYRRIPGNKCSGGIDLAPTRYECSAGGRFLQMFSFRNILILAAISAVLYYGWPMIEAMLLLLPIPDPKEMKDKMTELSGKAMEMVQGKSNKDMRLGEYTSNFDAPEGLKGSDEEEDDEEDIGRDHGVSKQGLDYDSDDKDEPLDDGAGAELISLDSSSKSSKKKVPKLRKPQ